MSKISFIYFDVGGVLIKDFSASNKWEEMYTDLGIKSNDYDQVRKIFIENKRKIATNLPVDDLLPLIRQKLSLTCSADYSLLQDFVNRFENNQSIWPIIKSHTNKIKLGLLTNMYPQMLDTIKDAGLLPLVKWDAVIDSSVEGVQKPDDVIYQIATNWASVPAEEILFVDNSLTNLAPARRAGWQTYLYDSSDYQQSSQNLTNFLEQRMTI